MALQLLLDRGADVNAINYSWKTVLELAIQGQHETAVRVLLDRGAVTRGNELEEKNNENLC